MPGRVQQRITLKRHKGYSRTGPPDTTEGRLPDRRIAALPVIIGALPAGLGVPGAPGVKQAVTDFCYGEPTFAER